MRERETRGGVIRGAAVAKVTMHPSTHTQTHTSTHDTWTKCVVARESVWERLYVVATISRLLKMIGLFCRISSLL